MSSEPALPRATYRLQLEPGFGLCEAAELADYLAELGVSHLYLSPIWPAVPGSAHGYDVVGHEGVREELGGDAALLHLAEVARAHGLELLVDLVPNHMAAAPAFNAAWWDLLREGERSRFAEWFDVDWEAGEGRVLLPWLDSPPGSEPAVELTLARRADGELVARVGGAELPAHPGSAEGLLAEGEAERALAGEELALFLERQRWQAIPWREPRRNVRRFFEIDDLVALKSDREEVFAATHASVADWVERGLVHGLRVDHVDGLRDPERYLELLRELAPRCWIGVEKILARDEDLPRSWPVDGTTGYEFLAAADELLVDPEGLRELRRFFRAFTGDERPWEEVVRSCRRIALERLFPAELSRCVRALERCQGEPALDAAELRAALSALLVELDVYRTYLRPGRAAPAPEDVARVEAACERARAQGADAGGLALVRDSLLARGGGDAQREFVELLQTLAPALTAKAVEDTALYRYHPLAALNEVGGDPVTAPDPVLRFHAVMARRVDRERRGGLQPIATHDAKRGAETRARLALLSEMPREWAAAVERWAEHNERHREGGMPDRRTESLYYQTLVGAWPLGVERALAYMEKAAREAKLHTSWRAVDERYEAALQGFVAATLEDRTFRAMVDELVRPLVEPGRRQCLALALFAAAAPGIPDIYRGCELWDPTLVDPDNRRPIDLDRRRALLAELEGLSASEAWERREEGTPMLLLWKRALELRRRLPRALSAAGGYVPLPARGAHAKRVVAFARTGEDGAAVAVAPRLALGLRAGWAGTALELPDGPWRDVLSERRHPGGAAELARLLADFPVALLEREEGAA